MAHHYDPNQPRVPAGHHEGGQWTRDGSVQVAQAQLALPALPPAAMAAIAAITAVLPLFRWLSAQNSRDKHAILEFSAREYRETEKGALDLASARLLTREEVRNACGDGYKTVQGITNQKAAEVRNEQPGLSPSQYGTEVHTRIDHEIKAMNDPNHPNLRSEVSYLKAAEEDDGSKKVYRGMKGTIRVDVYEDRPNGTACVYDIKTGRSGLSKARVIEIVNNVYTGSSKPERIIITEVRPQQ